MRRARWRTVCALGLLASSGCYWITSYEDLTDGKAADAAVDAPVAPGDALIPADAGPGRFCATVDADFCDDFDDGTLDAWAGVQVTPPDLLELVTGDASLSPPFSLLAQKADDSGTQNAVYVSEGFAEGSGIEAEFSVHLDHLQSSTDIVYIAEFFSGGNRLALWVLGSSNVDETGAFAVQSHPVAWRPQSGPKAPWQRVRFAIDFGPDGGGTGTVDVADASTSFALQPAWRRGGTQFSLGFTYVNPGGSGRIARYDDVVVRVKK